MKPQERQDIISMIANNIGGKITVELLQGFAVTMGRMINIDESDPGTREEKEIDDPCIPHDPMHGYQAIKQEGTIAAPPKKL